MRATLVVVGAGPKAMAIAAKSKVLQDMGVETPQVHIIEKERVGANWTGAFGYTNGKLPLGTAPEKDVGFPYRSIFFGDERDQELNRRMTEFSWANFLVTTEQFAVWVDRGKPAPRHEIWAAYLQWVWERVKPVTNCNRGVVTAIELSEDRNRWMVSYRNPTEQIVSIEASGIVMTGPGKPRLPIALPASNRVYSVESFWASMGTVLSQPQARVAVVGSGENAATVVQALAPSASSGAISVSLMSPSGMVFTRGESYFENRVYSSATNGNWDMLTVEDRKEFIHRTDRGVFSMAAQRSLDPEAEMELIPGRLVDVLPDATGVDLISTYNGKRATRRFDFVIVATGSDPLSFLIDFMSETTLDRVKAMADVPSLSIENVEPRIDESLGLRGLSARIHLPMLSGVAQGPGFANLSCLGWLSDRILHPYTGNRLGGSGGLQV